MWLVELARRAYRLLRPNARNSLAVALLLAGHDRWPRTIEAWREQRVLVLSPHPDDEAIGCAGAVLSHVAEGAAVQVVQVSDGANGDRRLQDPALSAAARALLRAELVAARRAEAQTWGQQAGVRDVRFLDLPDGQVRPDPQAVARLARWLDELQPQMVYLPFVMDLLEDHWQTARLFTAAIQRCGAWRDQLVVRAYEVWAPVPANRVADITAHAARKHELLGLYATQLRDVDYRRAIEGLNTYRSMLLARTGMGQAEAFVECHLRSWLDLVARAARPPHRLAPEIV